MLRFSKLTSHRLCPLAAIAIAIGGCTIYDSKPLTSSAVDKVLRVPSTEVLQQAALHLKHPILLPMQLDPRQALSPESAAVLAVLINPVLRADRDRAPVVLTGNYELTSGMAVAPEKRP